MSPDARAPGQGLWPAERSHWLRGTVSCIQNWRLGLPYPWGWSSLLHFPLRHHLQWERWPSPEGRRARREICTEMACWAACLLEQGRLVASPHQHVSGCVPWNR